jgi:hypothetical protein
MIRHGRIVLALLGVLAAVSARASDPPARLAVASSAQPLPSATQAKPASGGVTVVVESAAANRVEQCPCVKRQAFRPFRVRREFFEPNRPVLFDDSGYRYEPKIRDIRMVPNSTTLPGGMIGAVDTFPLLPPTQGGYFRLFEIR